MEDNFLMTNKLTYIDGEVALDHKILDLHTFSDKMTISQVVRFFKEYGYEFTKTMIQNYIRVGVLPPPENKRYYTKKHLMLLFLIYKLKVVFSLDEIKSIFMPILKESNTFDDDIINTETLYDSYQLLQRKALEDWEKSLPNHVEWVTEFIQNESVSDKEANRAKTFMIVLTLMAKITTMKQILDKVEKDYLTDNN